LFQVSTGESGPTRLEPESPVCHTGCC